MFNNNINLSKPIHSELSENCLVKGGTVIDLVAGTELKKDILIVNGVIDKIEDNLEISDNCEAVDATGKYVSVGFFDMHVHFREPGNEQAENIITGTNGAMVGGYTGVAMMPNTKPCIDNKFIFNDIKSKCQNLLVDAFQIPAVTVGRKGETIVEMAELVENGAVAFTDDGSGIQKSSSMRGALEYSKMFDVPILVHAQDETFESGVMNESVNSTILGMAGIPNLSEDIMVARDILIAEYTDGRAHFQHVSTKGSVELIRNAKKKGLKITAEVTPHHFSLTDDKIETFSTDYKMAPPLRTREDVDSILEALKDGTLDAIATDHAPHAPELKNVEFDYAPFGTMGVESAFSAGMKYLVKTGVLNLAEYLAKITVNPRKILNLDYDLIKVGKKANLTIFDTDTKWTVDRYKLKSLSRNTCFHGEELDGKVYCVINNGKIFKS